MTVGSPQPAGRMVTPRGEVERFVTPITAVFDPALAKEAQREMDAGKSFDAAVAVVARRVKRKAPRRSRRQAEHAETEEDAADAAEAALAEHAREWLIAIADREHGNFENLSDERLMNVAALAAKPFRALPEWLVIRGLSEGGEA